MEIQILLINKKGITLGVSTAEHSIFCESKHSQLPSSPVGICHLTLEELYMGGFLTIFRVGFFLVFFSFLARNDLKFLVFGEKSKCEKNATHICDSDGAHHPK